MIQKLFYFLIFFLLTFGASAQLKPVDKQYIKDAPWNKNPGFEQGRSNYSRYADAAGTIPVDMTGGSPNITTALNSTNPIDGTRDLIITKDAADRQGEGLSFPVTIPAGMQGQMIEICLQYRTSSAYVDDDVVVYAYDVTNASLASTEPAPRQLKAYAATTGSATHCSYLQALSNSTSYRVGLHISTTNAAAYTITLDNFTVGKVSTTNGAVVTAWKEYTPTIGWTNTTATGMWRRVGENAEIQYYLVTTASPVGTLTLNLPAGLVVDTSKNLNPATNSASIGNVSSSHDGAVYILHPNYPNGTQILLTYQSATTGAATAVDATHPVTWDADDYIHVTVSVPIVGWATTGILGQDATTQVIGAYTTGSATTFAAATTLVPTTISKDFTGRMSAAGVYTVDVSGLYFIGGTISTSTSTTYLTFGYIKNGGAFTYLGGEQTAGTTYNTASGTTVQYLVAGDTIAFQGLANTSVSADVQCNTYVIRMSGPANAVALESDFKIPVGTVNEYVGTTAPDGWLLADGTSYERTGIYARLYGVIGTKYGAADSTHFNVPDMRGRFARGAVANATPGVTNDPDAASRTACATGGSTGATLGSCQTDAFQGHYHAIAEQSSGSAGSYITRSGDNSGGGPYTLNAGTIVTDGVNGTPRTSSQTYPYNVSFTYIIKY